MPIGVEAYGTNGKVFSETSYAGNFFGSFTTNNQKTGSFPDARMIGRRLVYFIPQNLSEYGGPEVTLDANTGVMTWDYNATTQGRNPPPVPNETVQYGGY